MEKIRKNPVKGFFLFVKLGIEQISYGLIVSNMIEWIYNKEVVQKNSMLGEIQGRIS